MLVVQNHSKPEYRAYLSTVYSYLKRIEDEQNQVLFSLGLFLCCL